MSEENGTTVVDAPVSKTKKVKPKKENKLPTMDVGSYFLGRLPDGDTIEFPVSQLITDVVNQQRADHANEATVEKYAEIEREDAEGHPFPPIRAIRVKSEKEGKHDLLYVYDGFQRTEAKRHAKKKTIMVIVTEGTKEDALFYSLRANADHGLARKYGDVKKALAVAFENGEMMARIMARAGECGGVTNAFALAVGTSKGSVSGYLAEKGLMVNKAGAIVKKPAPRNPITPDTPADTVPVATGSGGALTAGQVASMPGVTNGIAKLAAPLDGGVYSPNAHAGVVLAATIQENIRELAKIGQRLAVLVGVLSTGSVWGQKFRDSLKTVGLPLHSGFMAKFGTPDFQPHFDCLEHWPLAKQIDALAKGMMFAMAGNPDKGAALMSGTALSIEEDAKNQAELDARK